MGKMGCMLVVLLLSFTAGTALSKNIVICGTVTDVSSESTPEVGANTAAPPCSVSVRVGCTAVQGDLYFAKTTAKGYYSLIAGLPDNCTDAYRFVFTGNKQGLTVSMVEVTIPAKSAADTLRQNLQLMIIDEAMPTSIPDSIVADWKDQDGTGYAATIDKIKNAYPAIADKITKTGEEGYRQACHWRRVARLKPYAAEINNIMFCRHHNFGAIVVGYHDNSDASNSDDLWTSKGALCVLNMKNYYSKFNEILTKKDGVVRDPCISFDGKKVLFAVSGNGKGTGYKICEMEIADLTVIRQLTHDDSLGTVVADFEPCYLPNGDIMFTSTRNFGISTHGFDPTTNMFLMNGKGDYMRQVGFDQVHTFYPVLMDDGTVLYTRWEFNDRDLTNSMGLFTMNPDGSRQTEYFGNQTPWPFTMIHGRPIPGTAGRKVICVAGGHHGPYAGELMIIDYSKGFNGKQSITMVAPVRETKPVVNKADLALGNVNFLFQTPCPLDEENFLVSWRKSESEPIYKLYFMNIDGSRELLAWADQSVSQPLIIKPRKIPPMPAVKADYHDSTGSYTMQNVYYRSDAMKGVAQGAARSLRVVKLRYRVSGSGSSGGSTMGNAPSGAFAPAIFNPVSAYGGSWDAKEVLGEAKIYNDGSAAFQVPARTPVYFQVIDTNGYCIATMRSWSTLMPGEKFACTGCHENKLEAPLTTGVALAGTPKPLERPLGIEGKPFDYNKMVQPIFDAKCASCHMAGHASGFDLSGTLVSSSGTKKSWTTSYSSLLKGIGRVDSNKAVKICTIFSPPEQQPPYSFGSSKSGIMLTGGMSGTHHDVQVTETERNIVACWIDLCAPHDGTYNSYMSVTDSTTYARLEQKREKWALVEKKNIEAFLADPKTGIFPKQQDAAKSAGVINSYCSMRYMPQQHAVILNHAARGCFTLVDLRGRVVYRMEIADRHTSGTVSILLPPFLSRGLYAVRFVGEGLTLQMMVSVVR